ncbi:MAG TPA: LuxR family transcriptional regulator [Bacillota bacterium]
MIAWLLYGSVSLAASVVMLMLLLGAARQGNQRARQVILTLVWLLPTYLAMTWMALSRLLRLGWPQPWWPAADWLVSLFLIGLVRLALVDWPPSAEGGAVARAAAFLQRHRWLLYPPALATLPLYLGWAWFPESIAGRLWFRLFGQGDAVLLGAGLAYAGTAVVLWRAASVRSPAARVWYRGILTTLLLWLLTDGLMPLLPDLALPAWFHRVTETLPHALLVLVCAAGSAAHGLIRPRTASGILRGLRVMIAGIVAVLGGGAVEPFVQTPWNTTLAALIGVLLFAVALGALRDWPGRLEGESHGSRPDLTDSPRTAERAPAATEARTEALNEALPPRSAAALDALTPRQREVVAAALEGLTNAEIADRLCIAEVTVKKHLSAVFQRLGVSTRAQLFALLARESRERRGEGSREWAGPGQAPAAGEPREGLGLTAGDAPGG